MLATRLSDVTDQQALLATTTADVKTLIAEHVAELTAAGNPHPKVGLVPTMGALHDGHGALFEQARAENDLVLASIFVNPLQFDQPEDFEHYPRSLDADLELVSSFDVDIVRSEEHTSELQSRFDLVCLVLHAFPTRRSSDLGLVPTMGALHDGHGALFEQARAENDLVLASIFVNPLQFDQPEDFEHYPRSLDADLELVSSFDVDIV